MCKCAVVKGRPRGVMRSKLKEGAVGEPVSKGKEEGRGLRGI